MHPRHFQEPGFHMAVSEEQIWRALKNVVDPDRGRDVVSLGMISGLSLREGHVGFAIEVDPKQGAAKEPLRKACEKAVDAVPGVLSVSAVLTAERPGQARAAPPPPPAATHGHGHGGAGHAAVAQGTKPALPGIRAIVAVASGKGGVGKSTTAVNLALGLLANGLRVGLLDADIYGPSVPRLLGITGKPVTRDGKRLSPMQGWGLVCMSMGFLVPEDTPMIWRGPMVMSALEQMMRDVEWGELDVMVVDLPPGTGDAQLTMAQRVPLTGAVIVTTPQDIALLDAKKGIKMFEKVGVPILGVVENMAVHVCEKCGHVEHIFGEDGGKHMAKDYAIDYLGALPLNLSIRVQADSGRPSVVFDPDGEIAQLYKSVARQVAVKIAQRTKDFSSKFPTISISKTT